MNSRPAAWTDRASVALIVAACALRIQHWIANPSLWLDESYLAVNILERGFAHLHQPLEYSQSAPYLFLIASKCLVAVFGGGEMVLRFIPLTASLLSLGVFWRLAKATFPEPVVPVVVAIFAFSHRPLSYAHELKQYSVEILLTTLVL